MSADFTTHNVALNEDLDIPRWKLIFAFIIHNII